MNNQDSIHKTDKIKAGDTIFSLDNKKIVEWEIIGMNPKNNRLFIVINNDNSNISQIHWKTLEYGGDNINFFSLTKDELLERFKIYANDIITNLL